MDNNRSCQFILAATTIQNEIDEKAKAIDAKTISSILQRCFLHRPNDLEIITKSVWLYLVQFDSIPSLPILKQMSGLARR
jgi:hypothetical protein